MPFEIKSTDRNLWPAIGKGMMCKCPNCGNGKLFASYLKVNPTCPQCGEELFHHRADDLPPYLTIIIVGHLLVFAMLHFEMVWQIDSITYLMWLVPMGIVLPLIMLPPVKGGVVGLQWACEMHGFDRTRRHPDPALPHKERDHEL